MAGVWTRNYTNALANFFAGPFWTSESGTPITGTASYASNNLTFRAKNGNYYKIANTQNWNGYAAYSVPASRVAFMLAYMQYDDNASNFTSSTPMKIQLGSGANSGDLYEAYQLNNPILSGLSLPSYSPPVSVTYDSANHKYTKTYSFGISNTSSSNKTISELGIYALLGINSSGTQGPSYAGLVYYDTFEPITLEPYESVVITISQSFPLINYQDYPVV